MDDLASSLIDFADALYKLGKKDTKNGRIKVLKLYRRAMELSDDTDLLNEVSSCADALLSGKGFKIRTYYP